MRIEKWNQLLGLCSCLVQFHLVWIFFKQSATLILPQVGRLGTGVVDNW